MILDSLTYLIGLDTKGVDKSLKQTDQAMASTRKQADGLQGSSDKLSGLLGKLGGKAGLAKMGLVGLTAAIGAVTHKLKKASEEHANFIMELNTLASASGVPIEQLDLFGKVVRDSGGEAMQGVQSLIALGDAMGTAINRPTAIAAKTFQALGISLKDSNGKVRDTLEIMQELSGTIQGMDKVVAKAHLNKLGITDNNTIALLMAGSETVKDLTKELREQEAAAAAATKVSLELQQAQIAWNRSTEKIRLQLKAITIQIITKFLEGLTKITRWMQDNKTLIYSMLAGIGVALAPLIVTALPAIISSLGVILGLVWGIVGPAVLAAAPFILLGVVLGLLIDDLIAFREGRDSLIGELAKDFPIVEKIANWLLNWGDAFVKLLTGDFKGAFESAQDGMMGLFSIFEIIGKGIYNIFDSITDYVSEVFEDVINSITDMFQGVWQWFTDLLDKLLGKVKDVRDKLAWVFGKSGGTEGIPSDTSGVATTAIHRAPAPNVQISNLRTRQQGLIPISQASIAQAERESNNINILTRAETVRAAGTRNVMNKSDVKIGTVTIQTQATDAEGMAKDAASELSKQLGQVQLAGAGGAKI